MTTKNSKKTLTTPNQLSITGSVDPTHALFFSKESGSEESPTPVRKNKVGIIGTLGSYSEIKKIKDATPSSNPQEIDVCFLPNEHNVLIVKGGVKFSNNIDKISSNNSLVIEKIKNGYFEIGNSGVADEFARRTVIQFLNGSALHRNARSRNISVSLNGEEFKVSHKLRFDDELPDGAIKIANSISKAILGDEDDIFIIDYEFSVEVGYGQEVYPSQEFISGVKDKILFETFYKKQKITGMHSQKIGNGLRRIDTWYEDDAKTAIPVDPFGPSEETGELKRQTNHFYKILEDYLTSKDCSENDLSYFFAMLVRGGVFSKSDK